MSASRWSRRKCPPITNVDLHLGKHPQANGQFFFGLSIENGRIRDDGDFRLRSGLRAIVERFRTEVRVTPQQDLIICNLSAEQVHELEAMLPQFGIPHPLSVSQVQRWSMACPAIPTCGLAITESERALPGIIDQLERELHALGLAEQRISVRMTGCPNGCARPYQSEIGLVGRSGDKYTIYLGGETLGTRLNFEAADLIKRDEIVPRLRRVLADYQANRAEGESFGDYCHKLGAERLRAMLEA
jgi:sulfite reductase (ferredoxin)